MDVISRRGSVIYETFLLLILVFKIYISNSISNQNGLQSTSINRYTCYLSKYVNFVVKYQIQTAFFRMILCFNLRCHLFISMYLYLNTFFELYFAYNFFKNINLCSNNSDFEECIYVSH